MTQFSDLPLEIKRMIFTHIGFQNYEHVFLVSKAWHALALDALKSRLPYFKGYYCDTETSYHEFGGKEVFSIFKQHGLDALEIWALQLEEEGKRAYNGLKQIVEINAIDEGSLLEKQKKFWAFAIQNSVQARIVTHHYSLWETMMQNQGDRTEIIDSIMGVKPAPIYDILQHEQLQQDFLALIFKDSTTPNASLNNELQDASEQYTSISRIIQVGGPSVAWLWATQPKLIESIFFSISLAKYVQDSITLLLDKAGQQVAWSLSKNIAFQTSLSKIQGQPALVSNIISKLLHTAGAELAQFWSTNKVLCEILAGIEDSKMRRDCVDSQIKYLEPALNCMSV